MTTGGNPEQRCKKVLAQTMKTCSTHEVSQSLVILLDPSTELDCAGVDTGGGLSVQKPDWHQLQEAWSRYCADSTGSEPSPGCLSQLPELQIQKLMIAASEGPNPVSWLQLVLARPVLATTERHGVTPLLAHLRNPLLETSGPVWLLLAGAGSDPELDLSAVCGEVTPMLEAVASPRCSLAVIDALVKLGASDHRPSKEPTSKGMNPSFRFGVGLQKNVPPHIIKLRKAAGERKTRACEQRGRARASRESCPEAWAAAQAGIADSAEVLKLVEQIIKKPPGERPYVAAFVSVCLVVKQNQRIGRHCWSRSRSMWIHSCGGLQLASRRI